MAKNTCIDLVLAKPLGLPVAMFYAPPWSNLKRGDVCVVEVKDKSTGNLCHKTADVESCITLDRVSDEDTLNFILQALGKDMSMIHKVACRVVYKEFNFKELEDV